jgi:acyl-CoA thioesterase-1
MIIMRRIILACLTVMLTACEAQQPRSRLDPAAAAPDTGPAGRTERAAPRTPGDSSARHDDAGTILFVGTSLTAGYGVGPDNAYPAVIQQMIDSAGLRYRVVNAGISGETSAGGLRRIDWSLQQPAAVLVLELGANDALRGLDPASMHGNLDAILTRARQLNPDIEIVLVGMEAPPNLGDDYARSFRNVFTDLARQHGAALVPFLLDGVAAEPSLNIEDGIHPNVRGHRILAGNVWDALVTVIRE